MNLVLVTTLAFTAAVEGRLSAPQAPSFLDQLSFLAEPCVDRGCAPDYCYPINTPEDKGCYKSGYPKCCTKNKGNCPNDVANKPGCECLPGTCSNSETTRSDRCVRGDGTCKGDTFCKAGEGTCGGEGRCEVMPAQCDRTLKQVCGCNGATYDNECLAYAHGVSVDYEGACGSPVETTDCTLDGNQCGSNEFCAADAGQCLLRMAGIPGKCQPLRDMCNMSHDPVCGCDMRTYSNADCAQAAGVNVASKGACRSPESSDCTLDGDQCESNEFCAADAGQCNLRMAGIPGKCQQLRDMCNMSFDPVCGCDMRTYKNADCAQAAGVNVSSEGACNDSARASCDYYRVNDDTCSSNNAFCRIGDGDCRSRVGIQSGYCDIKPKRCSYTNQPVCGCDSQTYANECQARFQGVNIMRNGEC